LAVARRRALRSPAAPVAIGLVRPCEPGTPGLRQALGPSRRQGSSTRVRTAGAVGPAGPAGPQPPVGGVGCRRARV